MYFPVSSRPEHYAEGLLAFFFFKLEKNPNLQYSKMLASVNKWFTRDFSATAR